MAASGLQDITTAFQGEGYVPNMGAAWRQCLADPKAEKEAATYLFSQGVTKQQLQNMQRLGYSAQEVSEIWKTCKGPEDRKFLSHIMDGTKKSYEEAFRIDPNKLSDGITIFLGPYSMRLLQKDENEMLIPESKEQFENFNNAILSSEKIYYEKMKDGSLVESGRLYRDIYLQRMYISSLAEIEGRAMALALMDPKHPSYNEYYGTYVKDMAVLNLWCSEVLLVEKMGYASKEEAYQLSMNGLEYRKNQGFSLNMRHYSPYEGDFVEEKLSNNILWKANGIANEWSRMRLEALAKAKETLLQNVVGDMILAGGTIAVGAFSPGFGIALSMLAMMEQGKAGNVVGLDSVVSSKLAKLGIKEANIAGAAFINGFLQWIALSEKMDKENWQQKMEWFGLGGKYTIASGGILEDETGITFANIYSPKMLRGIQVWEESGVAGWLGWGEDMVTAIETKMEANSPSSEVLEGAKKLLGCRSTIKEGSGIMEMTDMVSFQNCIELIETAYKQLLGNGQGEQGDINIQEEWMNYISDKM